MKKMKNLIFSILDLLVIAAILAIIIFGLWWIGLLERPAFIENLFGNTGSHTGQNEALYGTDFLKEKEDTDYTVIEANMTYESVKNMLESLSPKDDFSVTITSSLFSHRGKTDSHFEILHKNGFYLAYSQGLSENGAQIITEKDGITEVSRLNGENIETVSYNSADIRFEQQLGVVLTHRDFLKLPEQAEYTYTLASSDDGSLLIISFVSELETYSQKQTYKLNLDYGIITEAECYESGRLIYSLHASALSASDDGLDKIPAEYHSMIPDEFKGSDILY